MASNNQNVGQIERATQNRIVKLFCDKLKYEYLGNWEDRLDNSNIEDKEVARYLSGRKHSDTLISRALDQLHKTANNYTESLYTNNQNFYKLLRYGAKVVENIGGVNQSVDFIDWQNPEKNNFAIAEEVTIQGDHDKRPDIVLYINGIAIGVLELKRSTVSIGDGIRQSIVNQKREFIQSFFSTIQFVFAGNDTEGLKYGTIGTPEKYFLKWKEDGTKTEKSFENITISEGGGYSIDASQDSPELVKEKEGAATAAPACLPAFAIVLLLSATILRNN